MSRAAELTRLGLAPCYAIDANLSDRQMAAFRTARGAGVCAAVALDLARRG